MGLFDKKYCDICGEKIGLLGNRKLEDGNLCKDCAGKLSPWFSERRKSTVEDIRAQLEYRERNAEQLENFHETRVIGSHWAIHIDDNQGLLFITSAGNWRSENPDLIRFDQVTGCTLNVKQNTEVHEAVEGVAGTAAMRPSQPGVRPGQPGMHPGQPSAHPGQSGMHSGQSGARSGQPGMRPGQPGARPGQPGARPGQSGMAQGQQSRTIQGAARPVQNGGRYETYSYDFYITVNVNCDWFNEIEFRVNTSSIEQTNSVEYSNIQSEAEQIRDTLLGLTQQNVENIAAANAPKVAVTCPSCGASTIPDAKGCCEYCGSAVC